MPITDMLSLNAQIYPDEVSLIEREPAAGIRSGSPGRNLMITQISLPTYILWSKAR